MPGTSTATHRSSHSSPFFRTLLPGSRLFTRYRQQSWCLLSTGSRHRMYPAS